MNILVSGGSTGIGLSLVRLFADDPNNKVFSFGRSALEPDFFGERVEYFSYDLSKYWDTRSQLTERIGLFFKEEGIDIVVNNAGCLIAQDFLAIRYEDLEQIFGINFFSVVGLLQDLKPMLGRTGRPSHVVNIGSMGGFQGSVKFPGLLAYSASKAAIANMTEMLAVEWAEENIRVNCLALGSVDTKMLQAAFPGFRAATTAEEMARFIAEFALNGHLYFNGKVIPVSSSTP